METPQPTTAVPPQEVVLPGLPASFVYERPLSAAVSAHALEFVPQTEPEVPHRRSRLPEQRAGELATQSLVEVTEVSWVAGRYHKVVDGQVDEPLGGGGSKKVEQGLLDGTYVLVELGV